MAREIGKGRSQSSTETYREILGSELHKNPELVRDVRALGYSEVVPYTGWIEHTYRLNWSAKMIVVDQFGKYSPPNLDIMLPSDDIIDAGGYEKFNAMIEDRFRTAFETPVASFTNPYFQKHTLEFWGVIATVLAVARPEISSKWTSRVYAANDNYRCAANDNEPFE